MKLLVTGGHGFIGSHLVEHLVARGDYVVNVDKLTYAANVGFDAGLVGTGRYVHVEADIADESTWTPDLLDGVDVVVNLAAETHVDNSIGSPHEFITTNVTGTFNALNAVVQHASSRPLFVQVSTDEVFGDILTGAFNVNDRYMPSNPYAATKAAAEGLVRAWSRTYGVGAVITRSTNNYGPRQHREKLIPNAITSLLEGRRAPVHGGGVYVRNWIHVLDNVNAIVSIIDNEVNRRSDDVAMYHIGSQEEYSVMQVVEMIVREVHGPDAAVDDHIDTSVDRPGADIRYALNCATTRSLGWRPVRDLRTSISSLVEHYRRMT